MSVATPIQEHTGTAKPQRVLACVLCQQRKVKCDRKFPCVNCVRAGVQCVPATLVPRQRRRRFAERELLERLRQYEDLLRHNNIKFEPLHRSETAELASPSEEGGQPKTPDDTHRERNDPKSDRLPRQKADAKRLKTVYEGVIPIILNETMGWLILLQKPLACDESKCEPRSPSLSPASLIIEQSNYLSHPVKMIKMTKMTLVSYSIWMTYVRP